MFCSTFFRALLGAGAAIVMLLPAPAEAQIVRRYRGGGVAVRAPFVRVDVGPYGETSVRAPFVAVDDPGSVYVGPRARRLRRPLYAVPPGGVVPSQQPTLAEYRPLPTSAELAAMDLPTLVQTLRDLEATLMYELSRFDKAAGWQWYLALPDDALGSPGEPEISVRLDVLEKQLARFDKVAAGGQFAKIAELPSFPVTHEALGLVVEQFRGDSPALVPPQGNDFSHDPGPVMERDGRELLPAPPPSPEPPSSDTPNPELRSGERSIIKQR